MKISEVNLEGFAGAKPLGRAELKNIMGGVTGEMGVCTYFFKNGTSEMSVVTNPSDNYSSAREFAEAACASDPTCLGVSC